MLVNKIIIIKQIIHPTYFLFALEMNLDCNISKHIAKTIIQIASMPDLALIILSNNACAKPVNQQRGNCNRNECIYFRHGVISNR